MLARLAPVLFVLLWSSSFIAAKTGLRHLTPLLFVAIRLAGCAVVLTASMLLLRRSWRPLAGRQWLHCAVAGALLNVLGPLVTIDGRVHVVKFAHPLKQTALVAINGLVVLSGTRSNLQVREGFKHPLRVGHHRFRHLPDHPLSNPTRGPERTRLNAREAADG